MVRRLLRPVLLVPVMIVALHSQDRLREKFPEVSQETFRKTLSPSGANSAPELLVDTIEGAITVEAWDGQEIQAEISRTFRGRTREDLARAASEVDLKVTQNGRRAEFYVDGPFRCRDGSGNSRELGYRAIFDFQVKVPRNCDVVLRTVNRGDIRVTGVTGKFDVRNVNGAVRLASVAGAGEACTVNGRVDVAFSRNPTSDCSFRTVNGNLDVAMRPGLAAELWFKTFNGGAYTDYEVTPLPAAAPQRDRQSGKLVYRTNRSFGVRVGGGGPRMAFDTLNGDILVKSK